MSQEKSAQELHAEWENANAELGELRAQYGNREVYVMNADGTGQTNLTNNPALDGDPDWSPGP